MSPEPTLNTVARAERAGKQPYHTPHLEDFGSVNELTRSSPTWTPGAQRDAGTYPNVYTTS